MRHLGYHPTGSKVKERFYRNGGDRASPFRTASYASWYASDFRQPPAGIYSGCSEVAMLSQAVRSGVSTANASLKLPHSLKAIPILGFSMGVTAPRDSASGQASGKRQHKPIVVVKDVDTSSSQMFGALAS